MLIVSVVSHLCIVQHRRRYYYPWAKSTLHLLFFECMYFIKEKIKFTKRLAEHQVATTAHDNNKRQQTRKKCGRERPSSTDLTNWTCTERIHQHRAINQGGETVVAKHPPRSDKTMAAKQPLGSAWRQSIRRQRDKVSPRGHAITHSATTTWAGILRWRRWQSICQAATTTKHPSK